MYAEAIVRRLIPVNSRFPPFAMTAMHSGTSGIKRANLIHENIDCIIIKTLLTMLIVCKPRQYFEIKPINFWILAHYFKVNLTLIFLKTLARVWSLFNIKTMLKEV